VCISERLDGSPQHDNRVDWPGTRREMVPDTVCSICKHFAK